MAAPIINSVTPATATLTPGQFVDVVVSATDPDSRTGRAEFPVSDSQGNTARAIVQLQIDDPLTFQSGENPDALSITIQRITAANINPATYRITAT